MSDYDPAQNEELLAEYNRLRSRLDDPQDIEADNRLAELDELFVESADWFGTTGLDEDTERQLPQYIRREFGESVFEEHGLKAQDLEYIGCHRTKEGPTHFWKLPTNRPMQQYAFVVVYDEFESLGFGRDLLPPEDDL